MNRTLWFRIAIGVVVLNVAGGVYAWLTNEPMHGFIHGAVAFGFGLWANHLRHAPPPRAIDAAPDKILMLEDDVSELQRQLIETQERLDFADQLLKQRPKDI